MAYADEQPARVIDIDWSHDYCAVWRLDTERRRHRRLSYRRLDRDRLTLVGIDWWRFRPGLVEGDAAVPTGRLVAADPGVGVRTPYTTAVDPGDYRGGLGNVVAFRCPIGDGSYPVWIGRTSGGAVACFVAELELLRNAVIESD